MYVILWPGIVVLTFQGKKLAVLVHFTPLELHSLCRSVSACFSHCVLKGNSVRLMMTVDRLLPEDYAYALYFHYARELFPFYHSCDIINLINLSLEAGTYINFCRSLSLRGGYGQLLWTEN